MKLLYKPFAIIAGLIAARLGRAVFRGLWSRVDEAAPPDPTAADARMSKVVTAAALEAATMATVTAAVNRITAETFHYFTGFWPGKPAEKKPRS